MVLSNQKATRHIGKSVIAIKIRLDEDLLASLLPSPLKISRPGEAMVIVSDDYINDEKEAALAGGYVYPYYTSMQESALVIPCEFEGTKGVYNAYSWVNRDWAAQQGMMMGYNVSYEDIQMNKFPGSVRELYPIIPGRKVKGVVRQLSDVLVSAWVELKEEIDDYPWPEHLDIFGRRKVEDMINPQVPLIEDVLIERHEYTKKGLIFSAEGHLRLGGFMKDWDFEILDAYFYEVGYGINGYEILKDLKA